MAFESSSQINKSRGHVKVRGLLQKTFPGWEIREEQQIKIDDHSLYCDFMISTPFGKLIIEVDGAQHRDKNNFFHKGQFDFYAQQERDALKDKWAELNNVAMLRIPSNEIPTSQKDFKRIVMRAF